MAIENAQNLVAARLQDAKRPSQKKKDRGAVNLCTLA